jgi:hypothetical protein
MKVPTDHLITMMVIIDVSKLGLEEQAIINVIA